MAENKAQNVTSQKPSNQPQSAGQQQPRGIARREGYYPSREFFSLNPFSMMRRLSEEMDRAFSSSFGLGPRWGESGAWSPPIEVHERENHLEISAELPGMSKDDVRVECTDEGIVIEGEKKRETESTEHGIHRSERSYGSFHRMIPLPEGADAEKAQAEFKNGVLRVRVPLAERPGRHRQIPIGG